MTRKFGLVSFVTLISWATSAQCRPQTDWNQLKAEYDAAKTALKPHFDGFGIDDAPQAPALVSREWSLIGEWAAQYLTETPSPTCDEIKAAIGRLDSTLDADAIKLDEHTYIVVTRQDEMGNIVLLTRDNGSYRAAWNIQSPGRDALTQFDVLAAWSAKNASGMCYHQRQQKNWWQCGPMFGEAVKLPDDSKGHVRFYVDATHSQELGLTVGAQLSIWEWDGQNVLPLLVKTYGYMVDQAVGTRFQGEFLRIREKGDFKTISTSGSSEGRQMEWTIRVTPEGVQDLGKKSMVRELDLVDEAYFRLEHGMPAADVASPAVQATLKRSITRTPAFCKYL